MSFSLFARFARSKVCSNILLLAFFTISVFQVSLWKNCFYLYCRDVCTLNFATKKLSVFTETWDFRANSKFVFSYGSQGLTRYAHKTRFVNSWLDRLQVLTKLRLSFGNLYSCTVYVKKCLNFFYAIQKHSHDYRAYILQTLLQACKKTTNPLTRQTV